MHPKEEEITEPTEYAPEPENNGIDSKVLSPDDTDDFGGGDDD